MKEMDERYGHIVSTLDELTEDFYNIVIEDNGKTGYLFEYIVSEAVRFGKSYVLHANVGEDTIIIENKADAIKLKSYKPKTKIINYCLGLIESEIKKQNKSKKQ